MVIYHAMKLLNRLFSGCVNLPWFVWSTEIKIFNQKMAIFWQQTSRSAQMRFVASVVFNILNFIFVIAAACCNYNNKIKNIMTSCVLCCRRCAGVEECVSECHGHCQWSDAADTSYSSRSCSQLLSVLLWNTECSWPGVPACETGRLLLFIASRVFYV